MKKKIFCLIIFIILVTGCNSNTKEIPKYEVEKYDLVQKSNTITEATITIKNISKVDLYMTNIILGVFDETGKTIVKEDKKIKTTIKSSETQTFKFELNTNIYRIKSRTITIYNQKNKKEKQFYEEYNEHISYPSIEQYITSTDITYEGEKYIVETNIVNSSDSDLELGVITLTITNADTNKNVNYKNNVNKILKENENIKIKFKVDDIIDSNDIMIINNGSK